MFFSLRIFKSVFLRFCVVLFIFALFVNSTPAQNPLSLYQLKSAVIDSINLAIPQYQNFGLFKAKKIIPYKNSKKIVVEMSDNFSYIPFRPILVDSIEKQALKALHINYPDYDKVEIIADNHNIHFLIPNYFRTEGKDIHRLSKYNHTTPFIRNSSLPYKIDNGLQDRNIALWQSHGLYYNQKDDRWCWQRARVMTTVEDKFTLSFVIPYLMPMLERAGANVFLPRERDTQRHEVVVDNDSSNFIQGSYSEIINNAKFEIITGNESGFAYNNEYYTDRQNPFLDGTYRVMKASHHATSQVEWHPNFPENGWYWVSVAYHTEDNSVPDAHYTVRHSAGTTSFTVNQKMGGGTWIYLGKFYFNKDDDNAVILTNVSDHHGVITADAVRFGGGMGNIARRPADQEVFNALSDPSKRKNALSSFTKNVSEISGQARFWEGARYWLQWAGAPYNVFSFSEGLNDYVDDYSCRGLWVNWLNYGSANVPDSTGLNIPIDLSFAFHSDAGCKLDTIVGTLGIFTTVDNKGNKNAKLPNGQDRYASRDLTDIVMSQIVDDVRAQINPQWTRRGMWNKSYSESRRPQVPAMLLELLSHQNMEDMIYGLDPRFKFTVSRAIYKGMAKFIASQNGDSVVIAPLPIKDFVVELDSLQENVILRWNATIDTLEPSAMAEKYVVYTRQNGEGWDNGVLVDRNEAVLPISKGVITGYKVVAVNSGGASMDSEILTAYSATGSKGVVMIMNGFTRVSAPEAFVAYPYAGFGVSGDRGVGDGMDLQFAGDQNEFDSRLPWISDDASGWGNSNSNYEFDFIPANTHDFTLIHGQAIADCGYSFVSSSRSAVECQLCDLKRYKLLDIIFGEQKTVLWGRDKSKYDFAVYTPELCSTLESYTAAGGNIFVSGAYVVSDPWLALNASKSSRSFCKKVLGVSWRADKATQNGKVKGVYSPIFSLKDVLVEVPQNEKKSTSATSDKFSEVVPFEFEFAQTINEKIYPAESPDALTPEGNAFPVLKYSQNNTNAAIVFDSRNYRTFVCGFPFETILEEESRNILMNRVLDFLDKK